MDYQQTLDDPTGSPGEPQRTYMRNPGDPGTHIGPDGHWYDENGADLGPATDQQASALTSMTNTSPKGGTPWNVDAQGNQYGPDGKLIGKTTPGAVSGSYTPPSAPPAAAPGSPTNWGALSQSIFGPMPGVTKPPAFEYAQFAPPSWQDVQASDPGIQFGINQGEQALQQSAAARGTLNTGGTLKDILDYGRNAATQGYGNAFNRALNSYVTNFGGALTKYNTNYNTQYLNPYAQMWGQYQQGVGNQNQLFNQQFQTATG